MIEVIKQLVDALETYGDKHRKTYLLEGAWDEEITKGDAAIQAGKQAIAELESQEPMAWYCCFQGQEEGEFFLFGSPNSERYPSQYKTPLYEHLPQRTEPKVCCQQYDTCLEPCTPRGRHLAQRTWVGLTDEERNDLCYDFGEKSLWSFADSIEAKLKQKNGYAEERNT
jgi:hypothetical protein